MSMRREVTMLSYQSVINKTHTRPDIKLTSDSAIFISAKR